MSLPTLHDLDALDGARVLLRLDLNVPISGGEVRDATRIEAALPTVRWLLERALVVAVCSHLGKASGAPDPGYTLAPVAKVLAELLGRPVTFIGDCLDPARSSAAPDEILLLENLRFYPGEKRNDAEFARRLAEPFGHYVNDAFGTAHREHASVSAVPRLYGDGRKACGLLMEREVASLTRLMESPARPFVAAVGGAKISTKTEPLEALLGRVSTVLVGGGMANTFLLAAGREVGRSLVEREMVDTARDVLEQARERAIDIELPRDVVVADNLETPARIEVVAADAVPADAMIGDIGPATRQRFAEAVAAARTVFWNGPMGVFEVDRFSAGTLELARALAASAAFTVVGGGESVMAVHQAGVADQIDHVSTGGGASLQFLTGETLPAVRALET